MNKILATLLVMAATLGASGFTVHRSFKNGYPTGSGPGRNSGVSVGVNGASFSSNDARSGKKEKAKPKDDGTCWCLTPNGTRCKNRKDGEKDYCKVHAADRKVKVTPRRCRALTWEGTRCSNSPVPGYNYCAQHGAPRFDGARRQAKPQRKGDGK